MESIMGIRRRAPVRTLAALAVGCATLLLADPAAAVASYGPNLPACPTPAPGASCVVSSQTVGPAGKAIGPLDLNGLTGVLRIRRGTFSLPVQITVTQSAARGHGCQAGRGTWPSMHGYRVVGGIGILVQRGGASYRSRYARPVMLRLSSRAIRASSLVVRWRRGHMTVVRAAVTGRGSARIPVAGNASYVVLTPARQLARLLASTTAGQPGAGRPCRRGRRGSRAAHCCARRARRSRVPTSGRPGDRGRRPGPPPPGRPGPASGRPGRDRLWRRVNGGPPVP